MFFSEYQSTFDTHSVHENWLIFKNKLNMLSNMFIPRVSFQTNRNKPWFTKHLKRLENKKKRLFRTAKHTDNQATWEKYLASEKSYLLAVRSARRSFYHTDLPKLLISNPRQFWQVLNPKHTHDITLTNDLHEAVTDHECAEIFNNAFVSVFTSEFDMPSQLPSLSHSSQMVSLP